MLQSIAIVCIIIGMFFIFSSLIGVIRLDGFYNKIHAIGIADSTGNILTLAGLALLQDSIINSSKILIVIILMLLTGPLSTHTIAAAYWNKTNKND